MQLLRKTEYLRRFPGLPLGIRSSRFSQKSADHDILQYRHILENSHDLKGAADGHPADSLGGFMGNVITFEKYVPLVGGVKAGNAVEERRFAGAVRSDEPDYLPPVDGEGNVMIGQKPTETFAHIFYGQ